MVRQSGMYSNHSSCDRTLPLHLPGRDLLIENFADSLFNSRWSDAHVSEDFDISLRLQMSGWVVRLATYHNGGFKEGVSLTVYDELTRWEKYAYGCNELVFHPL